MIINNHSHSELSLSNIQALVKNRVPEGPFLDYKETAYSGRPQDIREMLGDISAFANAGGGYLILGIKEDGAGRASDITPVDDCYQVAQNIRQSCLDSIRDPIEGLKVQVLDMGDDQGIIVVHVPPSEQRPHMIVGDGRTDFFKRYDTDKRPMTIAEVRESVLENPKFRRLAALELMAHGPISNMGTTREPQSPNYVQIYTDRPVERFLQRYMLETNPIQSLVVVSPFIGDLAGSMYELRDIIAKVNREHQRTYVITRPPREEYQKTGISVLESSPFVEIRYNPDIHAKLYVCWSREEGASFALLGSGNLTTNGLRHNLEMGMMILSRGYGRTLVRELYQWGSFTARTISRRVKAITAREKE